MPFVCLFLYVTVTGTPECSTELSSHMDVLLHKAESTSQPIGSLKTSPPSPEPQLCLGLGFSCNVTSSL